MEGPRDCHTEVTNTIMLSLKNKIKFKKKLKKRKRKTNSIY